MTILISPLTTVIARNGTARAYHPTESSWRRLLALDLEFVALGDEDTDWPIVTYRWHNEHANK